MQNPVNEAKTKIQLKKNDASMETLQPAKQDDMVANNNNYNKYQRINTQLMKIKTNKYTRRLRCIHLRTLLKLKNAKN